jgi:hypothetical protein
MCFVDKLQKDCTITFVLKVECDVALVAIDEFPPQTLSVARVTPRHTAQRITGVWPLNLDDVCSEVS